MEDKVTITVPKGYVIDKEESTDETIICKRVGNTLPSTWREFCETYKVQEDESWVRPLSAISTIDGTRDRDMVYDRNLLPNTNYAKAMLALCQLIQLRDCYNNGWQPDWNDFASYKYMIRVERDKYNVGSTVHVPRVLYFKTRNLAEQFLENFKDLIKTAKPLL